MDPDIQDYLNKITEILRHCAPMRLSISAISRELGINRSKTVKLMEMLELIGEVTMVRFGRSKLYSISRRVPYTDLLDVYTDAVIILDEQGYVEMVNKKFLALFNFAHEKDITGINLMDSRLKVFSALPVLRNIKMLINGSSYEKEIQYIDESTGHIFLARFIPTVSNRGKTSIMISVGDITHQKFREEKCMILDQKLKTIFDEARIGIVFIDAGGTVLNINKASLEMLGMGPPRSVIGMNISKLLGSEDWLILKSNFIIEADIACDFTDQSLHCIRTMKKGIKFFEIILAPIRSGIKENLIIEYAMLMRDITSERNAMTEMSQKMSRYQSFFENTCNGMLILQPIKEKNDYRLNDFLLKDVNKAAEGILKVNKRDVIGKAISDLFPDTRGIDYREQIDKVVNQGIPQYIPPVQYRKGENEPWLSHYMFSLPSNEIASFIIKASGERPQRV